MENATEIIKKQRLFLLDACNTLDESHQALKVAGEGEGDVEVFAAQFEKAKLCAMIRDQSCLGFSVTLVKGYTNALYTYTHGF